MARRVSVDADIDYQYVYAPPDRLICEICHCVSQDPHLSTCCGHIFCKPCFDTVKRATTTSSACPICRNEEFTAFANKQANREVKGLHVFCSNRSKGCRWQGEIYNIRSHLECNTTSGSGCQYKDVKCPNECGKVLERRFLSCHVENKCSRRNSCCQYCKIAGENQYLLTQHRKQCPKVPVTCANKCNIGGILRENMSDHRKVCPLEMIKCAHGCTAKIARKDLKEHNKKMAEEHLAIIKSEFTEFRAEFSNIQELRTMLTVKSKEMTTLRKELDYTQETLAEFKLAQAKSSQELNDMTQELTNTREALANTESSLANTQCQLIGVLSRLDKLEVLMHQTANKGAQPKSKSVVNIARWSVQLSAMAAMNTLGEQVAPVILKMPEFSYRVKSNKEWFSNTFLTHEKGYKVRLCIDPANNGHDRDSHLEIFINLLNGPHDDQLARPIRGNFEVKILNQISDGDHYSKIVKYDGDAEKLGYAWFISHRELRKTHFLVDDCIFFEVSRVTILKS